LQGLIELFENGTKG
jgi:adenine deaminase